MHAWLNFARQLRHSAGDTLMGPAFTALCVAFAAAAFYVWTQVKDTPLVKSMVSKKKGTKVRRTARGPHVWRAATPCFRRACMPHILILSRRCVPTHITDASPLRAPQSLLSSAAPSRRSRRRPSTTTSGWRAPLLAASTRKGRGRRRHCPPSRRRRRNRQPAISWRPSGGSSACYAVIAGI
jgi:hypothetical protein